MSLVGTIWLIDIYFDFCPAGIVTGDAYSAIEYQPDLAEAIRGA